MELLVVIGIIALLIAILLPVLSSARNSAMRAACAAKLNQITLAAQLHANSHKGYYPLVGRLPDVLPDFLDDTYRVRYDYFSFSRLFVPVNSLEPITVCLATQMNDNSGTLSTSDAATRAMELDPSGFIKHFTCPQSPLVPMDPTQTPTLFEAQETGGVGGRFLYTTLQSYVYNEAVMGWTGWNENEPELRGNTAQIQSPALTVFCADGQQGLPTTALLNQQFTTGGRAVFYNVQPPSVYAGPVSLADAFKGNSVRLPLAGDPANFDLKRDKGRINIAFCDGHVETRFINTKDLAHAWLIAPR